MKRSIPETGEIYHVYNRGVEKRNVFSEEPDYVRFIHNLFEFNDSAPAGKYSEVRLPNMSTQRDLLVEIMAFCLMPNHYHLMLRQKKDTGITEFMRKIGTGYTNHFNQKYDRVGSLFQGKYKIIHIENEHHFLYLPYYIHLNPLDMHSPGWRDSTIQNPKKAEEFLEKYRWSSYLDYIGKKNFPSVTERGFLTNLFDGSRQYKHDMFEWLTQNGIENIEHTTLE
jgi:putative transposase